MKIGSFLDLLPEDYAHAFGVTEIRDPEHLQRARLTSFTWSLQPGTICLALDKCYYEQAADNPHVTVIVSPPAAIARTAGDRSVIVATRADELFYTIHNTGVHRLVTGWPARLPRVEPTAQIASSATLGDEVSVGSNSAIGQQCLLLGLVEIGDDCTIHPSVTIGTDGLFSKTVLGRTIHVKHFGGVRIGSNCTIHAGTNVARSVNFNEWTEIGHDTSIGIHANIGHDCKLMPNVNVSGKVMLAGRVVVGERAWLGAGAVISNGVNIGMGASVRIGSVVIQDVAEGADVSGNFAVDHTRRLRDYLASRRP